jgi:hypothetical protein
MSDPGRSFAGRFEIDKNLEGRLVRASASSFPPGLWGMIFLYGGVAGVLG